MQIQCMKLLQKEVLQDFSQFFTVKTHLRLVLSDLQGLTLLILHLNTDNIHCMLMSVVQMLRDQQMHWDNSMIMDGAVTTISINSLLVFRHSGEIMID